MPPSQAPGGAPSRASPLRKWIVLVAAALTCSLTARLGVWQLDRAAQKLALQQAITQQGALPLLDARALTIRSDRPDLLHRHVRVTGRWLREATVFLDNRQMDERAGFFVVTPLLVADRTALLVQRGWVPRDAMDRTSVPEVPTPEGEVTLLGRVAAWPSALYDFAPGATGRIRQNLGREAFAAELGVRLQPVSLQLLPGPDDVAQLARNWPAPSLNVERHQGYAAQWFALSALTAGLTLWFQLIRPWRQRRRGPTP